MKKMRIARLAIAGLMAMTAITTVSAPSAEAASHSGQTGCIRYVVDTKTYHEGRTITTESVSYRNVCSQTVKAAVKYQVIPGIIWSTSCQSLTPNQTRYWMGGTPNGRWFSGIKLC